MNQIDSFLINFLTYSHKVKNRLRTDQEKNRKETGYFAGPWQKTEKKEYLPLQKFDPSFSRSELVCNKWFKLKFKFDRTESAVKIYLENIFKGRIPFR